MGEPRGPFFGPLAHGFACGAHIPIHNSHAWNVLVDPVSGYEETRASLEESWGITTAQEWREQADYLLAGENVGPETDLLLHLRRDLLGRYGRSDLPMWRHAINQWGQSRSVAGPHLMLTNDPASPWRHIGF